MYLKEIKGGRKGESEGGKEGREGGRKKVAQ